MTAEDLYAFRFLADAQLSPDGERVAFVVRTVAPERDGYRSAIWLVPFDGSKEATRFTSGGGQDARSDAYRGSSLAAIERRVPARTFR